MATLGMSAAERQAVEGFRRDVIEPSMTSLVLIDFWAEWCGPCKQLTPIIERVAAKYADKGVRLVKINVDENKVIAAQFRIQSIPTVYAVFQGQPVADLSQGRTEAQLSQMLDQLLRQLPIDAGADAGAEDVTSLIEMGEQVLDEGDAERAVSIFAQIAELAPDEPRVAAGLARALLGVGRAEEAEAALAGLPEDQAKDPVVARARAALALAREAQPVDDLAGLRAEVAAAPDDLDARFRLAGGLMAAGDRDGAADALLDVIARDRDWNEGAARARLLKLFEAVGLGDPWVSAQRRRLSAILFT